MIKRALFVCSVLLAFSLPASAQVLVWPWWVDRWYFMGTTEELYKIRAAMNYVSGLESDSWTFPSSYTYPHTLCEGPAQLGAADCMDANYFPDGTPGPFNGSAYYLGMSISLPGVGIVEIPGADDLLHSQDPLWMATPCYGYLFDQYCGPGNWFASSNCVLPPAPDPEPDAGLDGGP